MLKYNIFVMANNLRYYVDKSILLWSKALVVLTNSLCDDFKVAKKA